MDISTFVIFGIIAVIEIPQGMWSLPLTVKNQNIKK